MMTTGYSPFSRHAHAYAQIYQKLRFNSEGLPELDKSFLRDTATSNHRLQLDRILETWIYPWAYLNFIFFMSILPFKFSYLLFAALLFPWCSPLITALGNVEKCSLVD